MRKTAGYLIAGLLLVGSAFAQLRHGDKVVTVVGAKQVRVRTAPEIREDTFIKWVPRGTQMKLLGKQGNWYQVILSDGREAWVSSTYAEADVARDLLEVRPSRANVRKSATTSSAKIGAVAQGDMLRLVRERSNWYLAILPDGRQGWIREDMVVRRPVDPSAEPEAPGPPPVARSEPAEVKPAPEEKPPPPEKPEPRVDFYQRGLDYAAEGRIDEAIEALQKAVEARPEDGAVHFELAKLLKQKGDSRQALTHFRKALKGQPPRAEATFYIKAMLKAEADSSAGEVDPEMAAAEADSVWMESLLEGATYLLPGLALGSLVFIVGLGLIYRRRRASRLDRPVYRRRKPDAGFDAVLKYAVEKRPLLRSIEEAERKQAEMDEALKQRFDAFAKEGPSGGPKLPGVASTEALLKRVEDLRQTILNQEERAQIYADLVVLQNEKIGALDEEIDALKKLIQLDYRDSRKGRQVKSEK